LLAAVFGLTACNRGGNSVGAADEALTPDERQFVEQAQEIHVAEIKIGRLAQDRSENDEVRAAGDMIVDDHEDGLERLLDIMEDNHIPQARNLVPEMQQDIDRMAALSGVEFDREFVNMMVAEHKKAYEMFQQKSAQFAHGDLKEYATDLQATLQKHLKTAQELQSKLFNAGVDPR
jgi:putative membrane protein